ncbi:MAG: hypothetical protein H8D67_14585 [Deltaproteobacteria bacterium]|nr:hypothetical protein [Deltaproteobacteria bacterium]
MGKKTIISIVGVILALAIIAGVGLVYKEKQEKAETTEQSSVTIEKETIQTTTQPTTQRPSVELKSDLVKKYKSIELIRASWGDSKGEVGLSEKIPEAGGPYGPESFDVDEKGNIYLLDTRNMRVIKYDQNGKYLYSFSFTGGATQDILVKDNLLYILNLTNFGILTYKTTGEFVNRHRLPNQAIQLHARKGPIVGIDFDNANNLMLETANQKFYRLTGEGIEYAYQGKKDRNREVYYLVRKLNNREGVIEILRSDESELKTIKFSAPPSGLGSLDIIGTDNFGMIYLKMELTWPKSGYIVNKYDSGGVLISTIDLLQPLKQIPFYTPISPYRDIRVNEKGDIYMLYTTQNHVGIMKYVLDNEADEM